MNYEELTTAAYDLGLTVKEKNLRSADGRIYRKRIAIRKDISTSTEKACVLAEELGHFQTSTGNILGQSSVADEKQEQRARLWAYNKMIGLHGIISAYKYGCSSLHEMAAYLDITEEFLQEALQRYRSKYGCCTTIDNYVIYFEPYLGILEITS